MNLSKNLNKMNQIQLKFILPFGTFSEVLEIAENLTFPELKTLIWEYFQVPIERQFIRIRNFNIDVRNPKKKGL